MDRTVLNYMRHGSFLEETDTSVLKIAKGLSSNRLDDDFQARERRSFVAGRWVTVVPKRFNQVTKLSSCKKWISRVRFHETSIL